MNTFTERKMKGGTANWLVNVPKVKHFEWHLLWRHYQILWSILRPPTQEIEKPSRSPWYHLLIDGYKYINIYIYIYKKKKRFLFESLK
jgi:hypothetical protein